MENSKNSQQKSIIKETETYKIRLIEHQDFERGYLKLLQQLTEAPKISKKKFIEILEANKHCKIIVIEDKIQKNQLIGTVKIFFDHKFSRNGKKVGHLEDLVVSKNYRKKGFGSILAKIIIDIASKEDCYKLIGNCDEGFEKFYEYNGFKKSGICFRKNF